MKKSLGPTLRRFSSSKPQNFTGLKFKPHKSKLQRESDKENIFLSYDRVHNKRSMVGNGLKDSTTPVNIF